MRNVKAAPVEIERKGHGLHLEPLLLSVFVLDVQELSSFLRLLDGCHECYKNAPWGLKQGNSFTFDPGKVY